MRVDNPLHNSNNHYTIPPYNSILMSIDRRLWSPEVPPPSLRRTSKSSDWSTSTAPKNGHSYLRNFAQRLTTKGQGNSADRGTFGQMQMVQPPQPRNQQQLLEPAGRAQVVRGPQDPRQQVEGHLQRVHRQVRIPSDRTDNSIKNHFYSTIRRCLRRINKFQGEKNSTLKMRNIKPYVLSKILADRSTFAVI